jgi:hypothetical protein
MQNQMVTINDLTFLFVWLEGLCVRIDMYTSPSEFQAVDNPTSDVETGEVRLHYLNEDQAKSAYATLSRWSDNNDPVSLMIDAPRSWISLTNQRTGEIVITEPEH